MITEKEQKSSNDFCCKNCNYFTSRKSQYERHISTDKHKRLQNALISNPPNIVDINTQIKGAKILLEKYGFYDIKERKFCESEIEDFEEPLHVEGMAPQWENLNQEFYKKNNLINKYSEKNHKYENNFSLTGFDRSPVMSLIIEAKKKENVSEVNIKDKYNYDYSKSLLNDESFKAKVEMLKKFQKDKA